MTSPDARAQPAHLPTTSSQTVGPYLHIGLTWLNNADLAAGVAVSPITLEGRIVDGDGAPVGDAVVEVWQANQHGRYAHPEDRRDLPLEPNFAGFGRIPTDADGRFAFRTIKPGPVDAPSGGLQAPHINVTILMRGMLKQLYSRIYFPDEASNAADPVLLSVPSGRRATLVAQRGERDGQYRWDVVLQGRGETVFFSV